MCLNVVSLCIGHVVPHCPHTRIRTSYGVLLVQNLPQTIYYASWFVGTAVVHVHDTVASVDNGLDRSAVPLSLHTIYVEYRIITFCLVHCMQKTHVQQPARLDRQPEHSMCHCGKLSPTQWVLLSQRNTKKWCQVFVCQHTRTAPALVTNE